ncbi:hypothetical protein [Spiroplasma cantharicola]|uniref:Uncharacterized protein n=1 Tax=Spiroplasma cantharicola TaxID=362837 RepID=A0A0M3SJA8_9MOLU|nr:hypothetical protein [Spiroplasma cantharicola]ALD66428.1 hypothetical protein SCANT_v1c05220 [Spiroplasma cantharicola]
MSDDFLDDNVNMNTLFHLLGNNQRNEITNKEINELCIKVLSNFNLIYSDLKIINLFDKECLKKYKCDFKKILENEQINLKEMNQYSENPSIWVEFLTTISMLLNIQDNYLQTIFTEQIKEIKTNIKILDKSLRLRLNLYHK